jgi:hypothetical protein
LLPRPVDFASFGESNGLCPASPTAQADTRTACILDPGDHFPAARLGRSPDLSTLGIEAMALLGLLARADAYAPDDALLGAGQHFFS